MDRRRFVVGIAYTCSDGNDQPAHTVLTHGVQDVFCALAHGHFGLVAGGAEHTQHRLGARHGLGHFFGIANVALYESEPLMLEREFFWAARQGRPALLVSGSRSACLAARLSGIRSVALLDYEHAEHRTLATSEVLWFPDVLRNAALPARTRRVAAFYEGLKENLYLDGRSFDRRAERRSLELAGNERLVVARPPADLAHYHRGSSWDLWVAVCQRVLSTPSTRLVVMPRTPIQAALVRSALPAGSRLRVLDGVVDGPALVVAADLVVGGGGTINREAAVLGTPVWSVFTGPRPFIDETLSREGRLQWVNDWQVATTLEFPFATARRARGPFPAGVERLLTDISGRAGRHEPLHPEAR